MRKKVLKKYYQADWYISGKAKRAERKRKKLLRARVNSKLLNESHMILKGQINHLKAILRGDQ